LRNLVRDERAVHPVWCVLFAWFASACEMRADRHHMPRPQCRRELTDETLRIVMREKGTIAKAAAFLSLSEMRVSSLCKRFGIELAWRPKFVDVSMQIAIGDALALGDSPKAVQERFRVSLSTVYRVLASRSDTAPPRQQATFRRTEADKVRWRTTCLDHPTLTATQLRTMLPLVWSRLYRNAPEWLVENTKPQHERKCSRRPFRHAPSMMKAFEKSIHDAESACAGGERRPLKKSLRRIRNQVGVSEYAFTRGRRHLSMSKEGESSSCFAERRVSWALARIGRPGKHNWAVAREAGLRQATVNLLFSSDGDDTGCAKEV
jgi:hypothetical protein